MTSNNQKTGDISPGITVEDKKITAEQNCLAVIGRNLLQDSAQVEQTLKSLKPEGYLIVRENLNDSLPLDDFHVLVNRVVGNEVILLLKSKVMMKNLYRKWIPPSFPYS